MASIRIVPLGAGQGETVRGGSPSSPVHPRRVRVGVVGWVCGWESRATGPHLRRY
jgi:hypothetical protein